MSSEDVEWIYEYVSQYIKSPSFRVPIKDFVDENCNTFFGEDENSFQQGALHNEFKMLVEHLLEKMLQEVGATQELFVLAAKRGLESPQDKKYFEQLIACDNYLYFKSMMIKRNLQLEEQAFQLMQEQSGGNKSKESGNTIVKSDVDPKWAEVQKMREAAEVEAAMKMSLALEEEKKRLMEIEEEELRRAIELSTKGEKTHHEEEMSLFNPLSLKTSSNMNPNNPSIKNSNSKVTNSKLYTNSVISTPDSVILESSNANKGKDYVDKTIHKSEKLEFSANNTNSINLESTSNVIPNNQGNLKDAILISNSTKINTNTKISLPPVKNKSEVTEKMNLSSIKAMLQENAKVNQDVMSNLNQANIDLAKKYEEIEKEQQEKLKDYRDIVLKMKKEKRSVEKEKEDNIFEVDESQLSEDVKKRLQLRKSLADKLKKI